MRNETEGTGTAGNGHVLDEDLPATIAKRDDASDRAKHPPLASIDGDAYIDDRTLAKILGCSRVTLQQARTRGEGIPYVKIGRLVRYSTRTVREWLATHTRGTLHGEPSRTTDTSGNRGTE